MSKAKASTSKASAGKDCAGAECELPKCPFVVGYKLFERVEIREADEQLAEYNDFMVYNQSQYRDIFRHYKPQVGEEPDPEYQEELEKAAELNAKKAVEHFTNLFGSRDFPESTLCGLKISWFDLQRILLEEFRHKTPATASSMNSIAPRLLRLASALLFGEYLHAKLERMVKPLTSSSAAANEKSALHNADVEKATEYVHAVINVLVAKIASGEDVQVPEFNASKKDLAKLRTPESIVDYVESTIALKQK